MSILVKKFCKHLTLLHREKAYFSQKHVKNVLCPYCSELFAPKRHINRHINKKHSDKLDQHPEIMIKHSCKLCGDKFMCKDDLQDHNAVTTVLGIPV